MRGNIYRWMALAVILHKHKAIRQYDIVKTLSIKSNVKIQTIYNMLNSLKKKGVLVAIDKGQKGFYLSTTADFDRYVAELETMLQLTKNRT